LEIMPPVSGLERCPGCHPERSEGSRSPTNVLAIDVARRAVILSAAKDLARLPKRSFAALRMTA